MTTYVVRKRFYTGGTTYEPGDRLQSSAITSPNRIKQLLNLEWIEEAPDEYVCDVCGEVFRTPQALGAHSRKHKGGRGDGD